MAFVGFYCDYKPLGESENYEFASTTFQTTFSIEAAILEEAVPAVAKNLAWITRGGVLGALFEVPEILHAYKHGTDADVRFEVAGTIGNAAGSFGGAIAGAQAAAIASAAWNFVGPGGWVASTAMTIAGALYGGTFGEGAVDGLAPVYTN